MENNFPDAHIEILLLLGTCPNDHWDEHTWLSSVGEYLLDRHGIKSLSQQNAMARIIQQRIYDECAKREASG